MNYFFILELCCVRLHFKLPSINSPVLMLLLVCFWYPSFLNVMNYSPHTLITLFVTATTVLLAKLQYSLNCIYPLFLQCLQKSFASFNQTHVWLSCMLRQNMCQSSGVAVSPSALAHCPQRLDSNGALLLLPFGHRQ